MRFEKSDWIGLAMFLTGIAMLVGWFFTDKVNDAEKYLIVASVFLMIFGAHFMSSRPTEDALKAVAGAVPSFLKRGERREGE